MKKVMISMTAALAMCSGCLSTYLNDTTAGADGKTIKEVTFYRGGLVTSTTMDSAEVNYNGVTAKLGNYSSKGDAEMGDVITSGIIGGILAYGTGGTSAVGSGVLAGIVNARKAKASQQAGAATNVVSVATAEAVPAAKGTEADVADGKYAVAVIGNRKGCPLCRALWAPGFEADVENALPEADVVDADLTDNPALYKKYSSAEVSVYPYAIVFGKDGKRIGAFIARGVDAAGFAAKVAEICPECSVQPGK